MKNCFAILFLFFSVSSFSQVVVELTIENEIINGTNYEFEIFLKTDISTSGDLFLGNADFALTFNTGAFNSPVLSKLGTSIDGTCNFVPTDPSGLNSLFTQDQYFNNTSLAAVTSNQIIINLNGPTPSDQNIFDTRVAKIDGAASTHRLGRYRMSNYVAGEPTLNWKTTGGGVNTQVFTLDNVSPFTSTAVVLITTDPGTILPVEFLSFDARKSETNTKLQWATASEINASHFEVEHSRNGKDFSYIGEVNSAGNSVIEQAYEFLHKEPGPGTHYYRLRQVDLDGRYKYTNVRSISFQSLIAGLSIFPNPANDMLYIRFEEPIRSGLLELYNEVGQLVHTQSLDRRTYQAELRLHQFPGGVYWLRTQAEGAFYSQKIVVQHNR